MSRPLLTAGDRPREGPESRTSHVSFAPSGLNCFLSLAATGKHRDAVGREVARARVLASDGLLVLRRLGRWGEDWREGWLLGNDDPGEDVGDDSGEKSGRKRDQNPEETNEGSVEVNVMGYSGADASDATVVTRAH